MIALYSAWHQLVGTTGVSTCCVDTRAPQPLPSGHTEARSTSCSACHHCTFRLGVRGIFEALKVENRPLVSSYSDSRASHMRSFSASKGWLAASNSQYGIAVHSPISRKSDSGSGTGWRYKQNTEQAQPDNTLRSRSISGLACRCTTHIECLGNKRWDGRWSHDQTHAALMPGFDSGARATEPITI
ncbi:hypothetical protein IF1G_09241 [Cordyceps javanica]|uniref:Uncharacterized protein n=1 Tax=Cordyceps javanica TaxID=43265 RepID=A0A545URS0_9HYPO|nr:hypothetical protein IF1G_09241 [Cordyceps javanica]